MRKTMRKSRLFVILALILCAICVLAAGCAPEEEKPAAQPLPASTQRAFDASSLPQTGSADPTQSAQETTQDPLPTIPEDLPASEGLAMQKSADGRSYIVTGPGNFKGEHLVVPAVYDGLPVSEIAASAFMNQKQLKSAVIIEGIGTLGTYLFSGCTSLRSVVIPQSATNVGDALFHNCTALEGTVYGGAKYVGNGENPYKILYSAVDKSISSVTIHEDTEYIQTLAFTDCVGLKTVRIPKKVKSVGLNAFYFCKKLETVDWDAENAVHGGAFNGCTKFATLIFGDSVKTVPSFSGCRSISAVIISDSVTAISDGAFSDCTALESIEIPDSVTRIGSGAFRNCVKLQRVSMSSNIVFIGEDAFDSCEKIRYNDYGNCLYLGNERNPYSVLISAAEKDVPGVKIHENTKVIAQRAFFECTSLTAAAIPEGVAHIGSGVFFGCSALTTVKLPSSMTAIPAETFALCEKLTQIEMPAGLTKIGVDAFYGCVSLEEIALPAHLETIGAWAFSNVGLKEIELPESLKTVGACAFRYMRIENIRFPAGVTQIGAGVLAGSRVKTIEVAKGNPFYRVSGNCLIEADSKTLISAGAEFTIPTDGSVEVIGDYAFFTKYFRTFEVPEGVREIGAAAFAYCMQLKSVTLPSTLTAIGDDAFYYAGVSVVINNSPLQLQFRDRSGSRLTENAVAIVHPDKSVEYANQGYELSDGVWFWHEVNGQWYLTAYFGNETEVALPGSHNGEDYLLAGFGNVDAVTLPDSMKTLSSYAFLNARYENMYYLTPQRIDLGAGLEVIEDNAFYGCASMESIFIPASVTTIGENIFGACRSLSKIEVDADNPYYFAVDNCLIERATGKLIAACAGFVLPEDGSLHSIAAGAFAACADIREISVPASVTHIAEGAFSGCAELTWIAVSGDAFLLSEDCLIERSTGTLLLALPGGRIPADADVSVIGRGAFALCTDLTEIYIPQSVVAIGEDAFAGCNRLRTVRYGGSEEQWQAIAVRPGNNALTSAAITYSAEN